MPISFLQVLIIILAGFAWWPQGNAQPIDCGGKFAPLSDFWAGSDAVVVGEKNGKPLLLSFSFDSEITAENTIRFLAGDPEGARILRTLARGPWEDGSSRQFALERTLTKNELAKALHLSEKQIDRFVLRKGAQPVDGKYFLDDLHPAYFASLLEWSAYPAGYGSSNSGQKLLFLTQITRSLKERLTAKGWPIDTHLDSMSPEITHGSAELSPKTFHDLIKNKLHREIRNPQTHLHIGLPAEAINEEEAIAIGRALETRAVLKIAEEWAPGNGAVHYNGTLLSFAPDISARGTVLFGPSEFTSPVVAHNLELRQWSTIEEGLENISLAAALAKQKNRLRLLKITEDPAPDTYLGNVLGALSYAAGTLERSAVGGDRAVAKELKAFLEEWKLTPPKASEMDSFRNDVSERVRQWELLRRLTPEAFLE